MTTIYVGNMNYSMTEDQLKQLFSEFGLVNSAKIITDKNSKKPKGYGFVEMEDDEAATKAIEQLNGRETLGRNLKVNKAQKKEQG